MMTRPGISTREIKSEPDPGPGTLAETVTGLHRNVQEAARLEAEARRALENVRPGHEDERPAMGYVAQAVVEKLHWRDYLSHYRTILEQHPELADKPIGTRCTRGPGCLVAYPPATERIPGADDDIEIPPHWSDDDDCDHGDLEP